MHLNPNVHRRRLQQGSLLLEALISILIFSLGVLAIVGLQVSSVNLSSDAKYRADASMLASQYVGKMWEDLAVAVSAPSVSCSNPFSISQFDNYKSPAGTNYLPWWTLVQEQLPNATALVETTTVLAPFPCMPGTQQSSMTTVSIEIGWQLPGGDKHKYVTIATVSAQKQN